MITCFNILYISSKHGLHCFDGLFLAVAWLIIFHAMMNFALFCFNLRMYFESSASGSCFSWLNNLQWSFYLSFNFVLVIRMYETRSF